MYFRSDETCPEHHGFAKAYLGLEVECKESVEDIVSKKSQQQETFDGPWMVTIDMVGIPAVDQFVEPVVFNVPAHGVLITRPVRCELGLPIALSATPSSRSAGSALC